MKKVKINEKENKIIVSINPKLYPLEVICGAAYVFLDKAYIYLDGDPKSEILISIKGKKKVTKTNLTKMGGEFLNELLNHSLRYSISKSNKKIREYILGACLFGASGKETTPSEISEEKEEEGKEEDWGKDPLNIAIPWEEKYEKKENSK